MGTSQSTRTNQTPNGENQDEQRKHLEGGKDPNPTNFPTVIVDNVPTREGNNTIASAVEYPHRRQMTPEEMDAYNKQLKMVGEFGVLDVPTQIIDNVIRPSMVQNDPTALQEAFSDMSKIALGDYNRQKGTQYQFVKVIRVNIAWTGTIWYYVTFQANREGFPPKNFQARICGQWGDKIRVEFCRVGPKPDLP
ncbi:hypothetical protein Vadar_022476 [Vaccinium darrowii]|uniref:Uncharacterized protein n=1 Tax=Vaccinium darrowii TaxID=229202 RepID=A0ACB7Y876_9ERIC|nr:hypothetical protein Vadar_022476 [Vaccinium darrowii]